MIEYIVVFGERLVKRYTYSDVCFVNILCLCWRTPYACACMVTWVYVKIKETPTTYAGDDLTMSQEHRPLSVSSLLVSTL